MFNTLDICEQLIADTVILAFKYREKDTILALLTNQEQIYRDDRFLSSGIQSNLGHNLASITERFTRNLMFKESNSTKIFHTKATTLRKCKKKVKK